MKKLLLFTFMMMVSLCLSAQNIDDFISEKTKDVAYSASNTMLINKKWYMFDKDFDIYTTYYIFRADKTGEIVKPKDYADCSYEEVGSFTWSRDHNNLTIKLNVKNASSFRKLVYKDPSASERKKTELKRIIQDEINETNNKVRVLDYDIYKYYINRLDAKLFLLEGIERAYAGVGISRKADADNMYFCTEAGEKEIKESKKEVAAKKAEEDAKKAEEDKQRAKEAEERAKKAKQEAEEAQKARELQGLNSQAYTYARAGKFDEAILAIDKAIAQQPQNANWYDSKGEILYLKGDKDGAKEMYNKVISIDPNFKDKGSVLCFLMDNQGWKSVGVNFPNIIPFKKIRVKKASGVPSEYCCVFFTTESGSNRRQQDTNYRVNYFMNWIYNGQTYYDKRFKKCTDVGDGWFEYEYSQTMYFSHYQKNAPKDCLQVLIE